MKLKVQRNIPFPKKENKELVNALVALNEGDCTYLSYDKFNKTVVSNCIASARNRISAKGLCLKTVGDKNGRKIWVFKEN